MGGIGVPELIILLIILGAGALTWSVAYLLAKRKHRSRGWWVAWSVLFGPLALLVLLIMPMKKSPVSSE